MPVCELVLLALFLLFVHRAESLESCRRLGEFVPQVLEVDGDVILGGLFPLHYMAPEPDHTFTDRAKFKRCSGFDLRAFRWAQTMVFAIEEINRNPDLLPGVTLGYRILDSCDHVHTSLQSVLSLVNGSSALEIEESAASSSRSTRCLSRAPVPAVIGLASSTPTRAVAHILGPFEIPLISYFATCTCLTDKRVYPSFLRTVPSDVFQVRALVQLMAHFGWRWVGTIGTDEDYSHYGIQAFTKQLEEWGGCVDFHRTIPKVPTPAQIYAIVDALEASTARVVVVFATEGQLLELLSEVAQRNLTGWQWVASEAWVTAKILTAPEFQHVLAGTLGFSFRGVRIFGLSEFLLSVRPSPDSRSVFTNQFWEEQFGCHLTYGDSEIMGRPLCTGLEDLGLVESSYTSASPARVSYNVYKAVYAIAHALHSLLRCTPVGSDWKGCNTESEFTPGQLLRQLKRVSFTSQFGEKVYFDENGEPVPLYDIINWQRDDRGKIQFQRVGSFDGSAPHGQQLEMEQNSIEWTGGQSQAPVSLCTSLCPPGTRQATRPGKPVCCFDCLPCAEGEFTNTSGSIECIKCPMYYWSNAERVACVAGIEEFLSFHEIMGIILVTLSLLGVGVATAVSVIFFLFRATPIVKANNSELSFLLLLSLKLCFLCSLVFMGRPSLWSCQARQAAFGISFVLCISCILVKTIVVLLAFRSTMPGSASLKRFGPPQQRAFIVACTAGQAVLCMGWLALAPPVPYKNTSYQGGRIVLECKDVWPLGFYMVLGYIGLLSCVCFVLAFLGRKLPGTFNEAKLITFSMLIFFAVWISFIPAYNSTPGKYTVAVEIFAILASAFGLLFCIFAPKCYIILLRPELNTKKGMTGKI
ncbi:extracellular calcium-sensing receptor [Pygocentrus nattereri]|uniref:G-protein coupled receptors family 3 profile domain-containing protein n=1 Tax=Pygocentrus nattereri TaxID=42514 RepID=A0A3B4CAM1_PYGNA|nr:extracellular calcium-sensing receptor [Pygocentrus nattereri]